MMGAAGVGEAEAAKAGAGALGEDDALVAIDEPDFEWRPLEFSREPARADAVGGAGRPCGEPE